MTLRQADRVKETAAAPGTGQVTLGGAVTGFQAFSAICANGDTMYYAISNGAALWEVGLGTYVSSGNKFSRTTILASSNSGSAENFTGAITIFGDAPAAKLPLLDASGNLNLVGAVNYAAEGTVTAAATTDLSAASVNRQSVTGNTTITSFGSGANLYRTIRFTGTPLITYNATSLITPTGANIQAAPGDVATLSSDASGNWRVISYAPFGGVKYQQASASLGTSVNAIAGITLTPGKWRLSGNILANGATGNTVMTAGIVTTPYSLTPVIGAGADIVQGTVSGQYSAASISGFDATVASNTLYYLSAVFDVTTGTGYGYIRAERIF